jgi:hypothetical protein
LISVQTSEKEKLESTSNQGREMVKAFSLYTGEGRERYGKFGLIVKVKIP